MAMAATRIGRPDLAVDTLLTNSAKNQYSPAGHALPIGSALPIDLPANGGLLAAVSLMAAGWDGATDCPGFHATPAGPSATRASPSGPDIGRNSRTNAADWGTIHDCAHTRRDQSCGRCSER